MIYDFIIVGAGISGLYTNYLLKKHNPKSNILILESSDRIGGRIYLNGKSSLGAKFLHSDFYRFMKDNTIESNRYYVGRYKDMDNDKDRSMVKVFHYYFNNYNNQ